MTTYNPTSEKDTATMNLPRVIDPSEAREADLLELSGFIDDPEMRITGRARSNEGDYLTVGVYTVGRAVKVTLLDRPEPPKPAPPTKFGSVVLTAGEAWIKNPNSRWWNLDSTRYLTQAEMAEKDWVLAKIVPTDDPTAKRDSELRERVEALAAEWEQTATQRSSPYPAAHDKACGIHAKRLRDALTETDKP